jgi:hypothetical protein
MKKIMLLLILLFLWGTPFYSQTTTYNDVLGDVNSGLTTSSTADIVKMEVSQSATDFIFKLTVNGNVSTTNWGFFFIGIATGSNAGTSDSNPNSRFFYLDGPSGDLNFWILSTAQGDNFFYSYNGSSWSSSSSIAGFSIAPGSQSTLTYNVSYSSLGISSAPGTIYFDAYSSGGAQDDGALDALANHSTTITAWNGHYTSNITNGLLSYGYSALPVELTSFTANYSDGKVILNWQTATEVNNYGFEIERAFLETQQTAPLLWQKIGFVQGHGNSNSPKTYSFNDANASNGIFQYRLKQIDFDGQFEYSEQVEVDIKTPAQFGLQQNYPNPFNPVTTIKYSIPLDNNVQIKIYNVQGQLVTTLVNEYKQAGSYNVDFDASSFPSGLYFYKISSGGFAEIKKMAFIK